MRISVKQNVQKASIILFGQLLRKFLTIAACGLLSLGFAQTLEAQNTIHIKGRVTNDSGQPVPHATVLVKGFKSGVSSDDEGNFDIVAPPNATLIVSSVNFVSVTIKAAGRTSVDVVMTASSTNLNEVVVVGYGTQKKSDITGAVAKVSATTLAEVPTANFISELKGRTAGVDIVSNSATPGGSGQIRIRGNRSMSQTQAGEDGLDQPLIVLDGIPFGGTVNDINPDDILSLDILKDASATAIYGSRGSGGVILITTKRGRTGKSYMSYNAYYGTSSVLGEIPVFSGTQYAQLKLDAAALNSNTPGSTSYQLTAAEQAGLAKGTNTDWQKLIYQHGITTSNNLTLSGGSEGTQYSLGATYYNEGGIIPNQYFRRYALRSTLDHVINNRMKIGLNTINSLTYSNTPGGAGVPGNLVRLSPLTSPYNADGTVNLQPLVGSTDAAFVTPLTLKTDAVAILSRTRRLRTFNSLYGELEIIKGLKYRINVGLDYSQQQGDSYSGPGTYVNNTFGTAAANAFVSNSESYTYTIENLLTYDRTFAEKHHITFTGLFSSQKDHTQSSSFEGIGIPADYIQDANLGLAGTVSPNAAGTGFSERGLLSYMARLNYAFDERFLLTATIRTDGASVLAPGHQYFSYPALAVGWNIYNEKFMKPVAFVSSLKIRGGWGITSNQGVAPYTTLGLLSTSGYNFGQGTTGQQSAYLVTSLANSGLHWESTAQTNIGLDFGILNNRITGSMEVYNQQTKDILLLENLPHSNGAGTVENNLGKSAGHGLEINLSTINITSPGGFTWSTDFNFSFNREKIVQLAMPGQTQDITDGWFVGQPLTVIYDYKKIGIWQTSDSLNGNLAKQTSPAQLPGQIHVADLSGPAGKPDGKIDANDRTIIGNFQPQWEGGFTSRMAYKNFDFSFVIFARMGMKVLVPYVTSDGTAQGFDFFLQSRVNQLKVNYWTRSNPSNDFPRPDANLQSYPYSSTLGYVDGSFIKMRSINLGYTVPSKVLARAGITSLRVYVTAENPFILYAPFVKKGYGPDPEGNGYGGAVSVTSGPSGNAGVGGTTTPGQSDGPGRQVSVNLNNPSTRQFNVGLNLKF